MSAEEVLTAFRRDAPYLFFSAAFAAVLAVTSEMYSRSCSDC